MHRKNTNDGHALNFSTKAMTSLLADEFWDFLGGKNTYKDLLDCFERVGIELRDEIDDYFKRFNKK